MEGVVITIVLSREGMKGRIEIFEKVLNNLFNMRLL